MDAGLRALVLLLVCTATTAVDVDMDMSGSGSGGEFTSGDGDGSCRPPSFLSEPPPSPDEKPVLTEIRCHVACLQRVMSDDNVQLQASMDLLMWPNVPDSLLQSNCDIYQNVQECRQGCVTHSRSPGMSIPKCTARCETDCTAQCHGQLTCEQRGTICNRQCDPGSCEMGCSVFKEDINMQSNSSLLPAPPSLVIPPHFSIPDDSPGAGFYVVDARNTSPSGIDIATFEPMVTSFIFRAVNLQRGNFGYYWLQSFEDLLNLETYSCQKRVLVQFAPVNKHGYSSRFSRGVYLDVYGDMLPPVAENPDPASLRFTVSPDLRFGFWKHADIRVSWDEPEGVEYLDHYVVSMLPPSSGCGMQRREILVPKNSTSAVIQAITPLDAPLDGCTYFISVTSRSINRGPIPRPPGSPLAISVHNPVPLDLTCHRTWNTSNWSFQFTVSWRIPDSAYLRSAIESFKLVVKLIVDGEELGPDILKPIRLEQTYNMSINSYLATFKGLHSRQEPNSFYTVKLTTKAVSSDNYFPALIPDPQNCSLNARPPPLPPITEVTIVSEDMQFTADGSEGELELELAWTAPRGPEPVGGYMVRVVEGVVRDGELVVGDFIYATDIVPSSLKASLTVPLPMLSTIAEDCLFVQLRYTGRFNRVSEWTHSDCIPVDRTLPSPIPKDKDMSEDEDIPEYLYVVIGLGSVTLVATVIIAIFVCVTCVHNRKASKTAVITEQPSVRKRHSHPQLQPYYRGGNGYPSVKVDEWEIHPTLVIVDRRLGEGAFGDVFQGTIRDLPGQSLGQGSESASVVVKLLKVTANSKDRQSFLAHIHQAKRITRSSHPHLVKMMGCVTVHEPVCLIAENPSHGDFLTFLQKARKELVRTLGTEPSPYLEPNSLHSKAESGNQESGNNDQKVPLQSTQLISFAAQIASGMEHLSSLGVVHGDVACRNVYLDDHDTIKLSDFGLARGQEGAYARTMTGRLPLRWMALEALTDNKFTSQSDVWAFGICLWEIVTLGGLPYARLSNREVVSHVKGGYRMQCPDSCAEEIYQLMEDCWQGDPTQRPHFASLLHTLRSMLLQVDCGNLIKLDRIDEGNPYYCRPSSSRSSSSSPNHEKLHRSSASPLMPSGPSPEANKGPEGGPTIRPTSIQVHPYPLDNHLPRITEEGEEGEGEEEEEEEEEEEGYSSGGGFIERSSELRNAVGGYREGRRRWRSADEAEDVRSVDSSEDSAVAADLPEQPMTDD